MGKTYKKNSDFHKKNHRSNKNKDSHKEYDIPEDVWRDIETPEQRVKRRVQLDQDMWNMYGKKDV